MANKYLFGLILVVVLRIPQGVKGVNAHQCGVVKTLGGRVIKLRHNVTLSDLEFGYVNVRKLHGGEVAPEHNCVVQVCGHSGGGLPAPEGYLGFYEEGNFDWLNCQIIKKTTKLNTFPFMENFNTSFISCGCSYNNPNTDLKCLPSCQREMNWSTTDCAVLYEEKKCESCYFPPIPLSDNSSYKTDNSHHIQSFIVREGCTLTHELPGLPKVWRFRNLDAIRLHQGPFVSESFLSSYHSEYPELFKCQCGGEESTHVSEHTTPSPRLPGNKVTNSEIPTNAPKEVSSGIPLLSDLVHDEGTSDTTTVIAVTVPMAVIASSILCFLVWRTRKSRLSSTSTLETDVETNSQESEAPKLSPAAPVNPLIASEPSMSMINQAYILAPHQIITSDTTLGQGAFGKVLKASKIDSSDGLSTPIAVKVISQHFQTCFYQEAFAFQKIENASDHIVKFFGVFLKDDPDQRYNIVMELCDASLLTHLENMRTNIRSRTLPELTMRALDEDYSVTAEEEEASIQNTFENKPTPTEIHDLVNYCWQIAYGMEFLHQHGLIHTDLALKNVLLKDKIVKLCDFGISKVCKDPTEYYSTTTLDQRFPLNSFAPEWATLDPKNPKRVTKYVDVWAFGCTIWEIFTLDTHLYPSVHPKDPARFDKVAELLRRVPPYRHDPPELLPPQLNSLYEIMMRCWNQDFHGRPEFTVLKEELHNILACLARSE